MADSEAQLLLAELSKLENLRNPARCEGKRQFQRFVVRADAELSRMDRSRLGESPIPIMLRDIGRGGVGFVTTTPIEVDTRWRISFLQHNFSIAHMGMMVRHCRTIKEGVYLFGSQFCADSGLLFQLGVNPQMVGDGDGPVAELDVDTFVAPADVQ